MKTVEISSVFKRLDETSKGNYHLISTLSSFTKIFESILFVQLYVNICKTSSQNISQVSEKVIICSIPFQE